MRTDVVFRNPATGQQKKIKVGWSWTLFFFTTLYGIPLFLRGLNRQGWLALAFAVFYQLQQWMTRKPSFATTSVGLLLAIAAHVAMAIKGNEMTAKKLLAEGWEFAEPKSDAVKFAKLKWGLSEKVAAKS